MENQKNQVVELSDNQCSPRLAKPTDFVVGAPDRNEEYPVHGQLGNSAKECAELKAVGGKSRGEEKGSRQSNYDVTIQHERAREQRGKQNEKAARNGK